MVSRLLQQCVGARPDEIFEDFFPDGITAIAMAWEAGRIVVATGNGRLCLMNSGGQRLREAFEVRDVHQLALAHTAAIGLAVCGDRGLYCFDHDLQKLWDGRVTGKITAVAAAPHGSHFAFATDSSKIHIITSERREVSVIETRRPVTQLHFLAETTELIAAAEFGEFSRYNLQGKTVWAEPQVSNIGSMAVAEPARRILLAAFNHGVQVFDLQARHLGSFNVDGIPSKVACTTTRHRLAVVTEEHRIFWLSFDGNVLWAADLSHDPLQHVAVSALGDQMLLASASGCLLNGGSF